MTDHNGQRSALDMGNIQTACDLKNLVTRIRSVEKNTAVRLIATGEVLAAYVCTVAPETLLDTAPTILGMRAMKLGQPAQLDVTVESSALLDRLARIADTDCQLEIPPVTVTASWAGMTPPMAGWIEQDPVMARDLHRAAEEGMQAVEQALPNNPGHAVVGTVRSRIWASPLQPPTGGYGTLPTGVAFTAAVLGFLPKNNNSPIRLFAAEDWLRLNAPAGFVLVKQGRKN